MRRNHQLWEMGRHGIRIVIAWGCLLVGEVSAEAAQANLTMRTIAISGGVAPSAGLGVVFTNFAAPFLSPEGHVVFRATLAGPGITTANDRAIFMFPPDNSGVLVARESSPAPGTGTTYNTLDSAAVVDGRGGVSFSGTITGAAPNADTAVWGGDTASIALLWREGNIAPGTSQTFGSVSSPAYIRNSPMASYRAFAANVGSSGHGIWSQGPSGLRRVVGLGDVDVATGRTFTSAQGLYGVGTDGGICLAGVLDDFRLGVWIERPTLVPAFLSGQLVPMGIGHATFSDIDRLAANNNKFIAVVGRATGAGLTAANNQGVWTDRSGVITQIARSGDPAPTAPAGGAVFTNITTVLINQQNMVSFASRLAGGAFNPTTDMCICLEDPAFGLQLVMRTGMPAPGTEEGVVFQGSFAGDPGSLNAAGEMVFTGLLTGTGVTAANDWGFWLYRMRRLSLIVREGDQLLVAPGDWRTITSLSPVFPSGIDDGSRAQWTDRSQLLFVATFADGTRGMFLAELGELPTLGYQNLLNGVELSWEGSDLRLEATPALDVLWTNAPSQANPQLVPTTASAQFFRLVR